MTRHGGHENRSDRRKACLLGDSARPRGDGTEDARLVGDRFGGALVGRAGIDRQRGGGLHRLFRHPLRAASGRRGPSVRASQGRIHVGGGRGRADHRRGTTDRAGGLGRAVFPDAARGAGAGSCDQRACRGDQCRLGDSADPGRREAPLAGALCRRASHHVRRGDLRRGLRRPDPRHPHRIRDPRSGHGHPGGAQHPLPGLQGDLAFARRADGPGGDAGGGGDDPGGDRHPFGRIARGPRPAHRRAGSAAFIDFHLVVPSDMAVARAHEICDRLEDAIKQAIPGASLAIHVEPESEQAHGIRVKLEGTDP